MKFINPHFKSTTQKRVAQHQPAVDAWLTAQTDNRVITLAELRAGLPAIAGELSREVVNQICANIGAEVVDPEDAQS